MNSLREQFRQLLQEQRTDYQRALPEKLAQLQTLWAAADSNASTVTTPELAEFERLAHTLAGTAGTLGLRDVGLAAGALEVLLAGAREGGTALTAAQRSDISLALAALLACPRE